MEQEAKAMEAFITRWESSDASERSNAPVFLTKLCEMLGLDQLESNVEKVEGHIRYLRPDYQNPDGPKEEQGELLTTPSASSGQAKDAKLSQTLSLSKGNLPAGSARQPWPKTLPEQLRAIRTLLETAPQPLNETQIAKHFTRAPKKKIAELIEVLEGLG